MKGFINHIFNFISNLQIERIERRTINQSSTHLSILLFLKDMIYRFFYQINFSKRKSILKLGFLIKYFINLYSLFFYKSNIIKIKEREYKF